MKKTAAAALSALALAGSMMLATPAHAITNPAANPNPKTVKGDDGRTYEDGRDTLPGYDDEECSYIPGAWYDFDNNLVHYADGQSARWTEWDRVPGYKTWLEKKNAVKPTAAPSASTGAKGSAGSSKTGSSKTGSTKTGSTKTGSGEGSKSASGSGSTATKSAAKSSKSGTTSGSSRPGGTKGGTDAGAAGGGRKAAAAGAQVAAGAGEASVPGAEESVEGLAAAEAAAQREREAKEAQAADLEAAGQAERGDLQAVAPVVDDESADGAVLDARLTSGEGQVQAGPADDTTLAGLGILAALAALGALALGGWGVFGARAGKGGAE